jgi:hypothetical protein
MVNDLKRFGVGGTQCLQIPAWQETLFGEEEPCRGL